MPKRPKKEEENDSTDMDFGLFDNLSAGIGVLSDMGMAGVGAAGELVGNIITYAQQRMKYTFLRNMLRHVYGCVPLSNENLTVLSKIIPEGRAGFIWDTLQPFHDWVRFTSDPLTALLHGGDLDISNQFFEDVRANAIQERDYRLPKDLVLPGPYKVQSMATMCGYYHARNVHVVGACNHKDTPFNTRGIVIWMETLEGPLMEHCWADMFKTSLIKHFHFKRVRDLGDWKPYIDEFLKTIPLTANFSVHDLLETSLSEDRGILINETPYQWHKDTIPSTVVIIDSKHNPRKLFQSLLMGKLNAHLGWNCPDVKYVRQDGSGMYSIVKDMKMWMPKDGTFFPNNACKVCCFTYGQVEIFEPSATGKGCL